MRKVRDLGRLRDSGRAATAGRAPLVAAWLSHWLENIAARTVRPRTLDGYRTYIERYAIPGLGAHRLDRLQPEHIEALYVRMQQSGLTPGTVHSLHRILRSALNEAVRRDKLTRNPVLRARPPRLTEREMEPLTRDEAARLIDVASAQPGGARWSVALALGLRQGEALGLCWDVVNLDAGTLSVRRALQRHTAQHGCAGTLGVLARLTVPTGSAVASCLSSPRPAPDDDASRCRVLSSTACVSTASVRWSSACERALSGRSTAWCSASRTVGPLIHAETGLNGKSCWLKRACATHDYTTRDTPPRRFSSCKASMREP